MDLDLPADVEKARNMGPSHPPRPRVLRPAKRSPAGALVEPKRAALARDHTKTNARGERPVTSAVIRRRSKDVVKSAGRSLEVLELLRDARKPLRLTDIASALSLPQSSAAMLVRSLVGMGYLIRKDRSYAPSMRITLLGSWLNDSMFSQGNLTSLIQELSRLTGDTAVLATRNGLFVEVLSVVQSRMESIYYIRPGVSRPLTCALMGHMILSTMEPEEAEALVLRINAEQKKAEHRVQFKTLMPVLDGIRDNGYGYVEGTIPGAATMAMLLPPGPFGDTLVIGNIASIGRLQPRRDEVLRHMQAAIRKYLHVER